MSQDTAVAVVLAAGEAKRMGLPKALLEHEKGKTFLQALRSAFEKAGCQVLTVVGKDADQIRTHHPQAELVENSDWAEGQFSSVKKGLSAALETGAAQIFVHPVDMPMVRAGTITALREALSDGEVDGVVPEFEGAAGHPLGLSAEAARKILTMDVPHLEAAQKELTIRRVKTRDPAVMVNLNTPEIYERILGMAPRLAPLKKRRGAPA